MTEERPFEESGEPQDSSESNPPEEAASAIRKLSENDPERLTRVTEVLAMGMGSAGNPLQAKMTENHVSQVLELAAKHDERQFELHREAERNAYLEGRSHRVLSFLTFVIIAALVAGVLYLFREQPEVIIPLLTGIGGTGAGFLGGWGYGRRQR